MFYPGSITVVFCYSAFSPGLNAGCCEKVNGGAPTLVAAASIGYSLFSIILLALVARRWPGKRGLLARLRSG